MKRKKEVYCRSPAGFFSDKDKGIMHYKGYISTYKKEGGGGGNYLSFRLKFLWYNKMLKPTKRSRDQEIYVTIFALVSV